MKIDVDEKILWKYGVLLFKQSDPLTDTKKQP